MAWQVDFYQEEDSSAPVEEFLEGLPKKQQAKVLALIRKLEEEGPNLPYPSFLAGEGEAERASDAIQ